MTASSAQTLVLIDGHALAYRSYFALPPLTSSKGEATNAVVGFLRYALRLARMASHQMIVVFDPPIKTFRHEKYADYKSGRAQTPEDLPGQIHRIRQLVDALGWPRLEEPGYEADDVIASLTRMAEGKGFEVRIVTSDRDAYQLLDDHVRVIHSDFTTIGPEQVYAKYGVTVAQWVDYRALTGDASDNIPGAKGIGPKTAAKLLQQYGTLDAVIEAAHAGTLLPVKTSEKIIASQDNIRLSHELSCMVTNLPLEIKFGEIKGPGDIQELHHLLNELELTSLKRDLLALMQPQPTTPLPVPASKPHSLSEWRTPGCDVTWGYVLSREDELTADLTAAATFDGQHLRAAPTEQRADQPLPVQMPETPLFGTQQVAKQKTNTTGPRSTQKTAPQARQIVSEIEFVGQKILTAANAKALAAHLSVRGTAVQPGDDPLLVAYLLDPSNTTMETVSQRYLQCEWPEDATQRAVITHRLLHELLPKLDQTRRKLYEEMEKPLAHVLARMEVCGVRLDCAYLQGLSKAVLDRLSSLEAEIYRFAGREFSIRSRDQLERVLYDELGLLSGKKTKLTGKRSTAITALEPLRNEHPIIPLLLEYRELEKLRGTYLEPLSNLVHPLTGRLHTTFAQTAVATGRLSSLNPNLQNIPIRSQTGREIRKGFTADDGYILVSADYSQIELRLLAHIADDPLMQQAFVEGADIHRRTAAQVLGIAEATVTPDQRRAAKTVNFGVLYGMSAHRLSHDLSIPYTTATGFIETYFSTYPGIRRYIDYTLEFGRLHGYVETLYGRRRYVPELRSPNRTIREAGERLAYNMPIQGTAADIIKLAMVHLDKELSSLGARLLLQVHDELLIEVPVQKEQAVTQVTRQVMEGVVTLKVPLAVEIGSGPNWYDTKSSGQA